MKGMSIHLKSQLEELQSHFGETLVRKLKEIENFFEQYFKGKTLIFKNSIDGEPRKYKNCQQFQATLTSADYKLKIYFKHGDDNFLITSSAHELENFLGYIEWKEEK